MDDIISDVITMWKYDMYLTEVTIKSLLYEDIYINGEVDSVEDLSFGSGTTVVIEAEVSFTWHFLLYKWAFDNRSFIYQTNTL